MLRMWGRERPLLHFCAFLQFVKGVCSVLITLSTTSRYIRPQKQSSYTFLSKNSFRLYELSDSILINMKPSVFRGLLISPWTQTFIFETWTWRLLCGPCPAPRRPRSGRLIPGGTQPLPSDQNNSHNRQVHWANSNQSRQKKTIFTDESFIWTRHKRLCIVSLVYRKWNVSNILVFLFFNRIHFNLHPRNCSSL